MPFGNRKIHFREYFQFSIVTIKKYHPSGNLKFTNLGIFQSLKLRILKKKSFQFLLIYHSKYFGLFWVKKKTY